jgi:undecaprenyl diphosphate synthase
MNDLEHLGVIMDGNRRWAKKNMLKTVIDGHRAGTKRFIDLCSWCVDEKIPYVTVFAFSTDNWDRAKEEVQGIFDLMEEFFRTEIQTCIEKGVKLTILGDRTKLKPKSQETIKNAEYKTKDCSALHAQIAINYGGRDEIIRGIKKLLAQSDGTPYFIERFNDVEFEKYLDTAGMPDMDLVIRTGADGRNRLSGFFPWQSVYAELQFLDVLWPDFSKNDLLDAINWFRGVERLKGGGKVQLGMAGNNGARK